MTLQRPLSQSTIYEAKPVLTPVANRTKIEKLLAVFEAASCDIRQQASNLVTSEGVNSFQTQSLVICDYMDLARRQILHNVDQIQKENVDISNQLQMALDRKSYYKQKCRQLQQALGDANIESRSQVRSNKSIKRKSKKGRRDKEQMPLQQLNTENLNELSGRSSKRSKSNNKIKAENSLLIQRVHELTQQNLEILSTFKKVRKSKRGRQPEEPAYVLTPGRQEAIKLNELSKKDSIHASGKNSKTKTCYTFQQPSSQYESQKSVQPFN